MKVAILGGGPAGLTAAYELQRLSGEVHPVVVEAGALVGGLARTESHRGYRFDIGGHRFFTKVPEVEALWTEVLGDDFITVPRKSRIFYRGRFYDYPLKLFNALANLGVYEACRIVASCLKWRLFPYREEENFRQWVTNRFGGRLYMHFFRSYTEKVWGVADTEIRADWAAQRIRDLSLLKAIRAALGFGVDTASLIEEFRYPRLGPGMMWEKMTDLIRRDGGEVGLGREVVRVNHAGGQVASADVRDRATGDVERIEAEHFISSLALRDLIGMMDPPPPPHVTEAAGRLRYRDFLIVTLVLDHADPFPDNWIYVHSPDVRVARIQNFRAWSAEMVPEPDRASIGMEYFCNEHDDLWRMPDEELIALAAKELSQIRLAPEGCVVDGAVIRQRKAYPVYDTDYAAALEEITGWLSGLTNLQCVGRNGQHRYNNQDHSMLTAMLAARNVLGADHDVWDVNVERSYHEEMQLNPAVSAA